MRRVVYPAATIFSVLAIWQLATSIYEIPDYQLPSSLRILETLSTTIPEMSAQARVTALESLWAMRAPSCLRCPSLSSLCGHKTSKPPSIPLGGIPDDPEGRRRTALRRLVRLQRPA
jgi:hypothetical protein